MLFDQQFLDRILRVAPLNRAPGQWAFQLPCEHGVRFPTQDRRLTDADIIRALTHKGWIASRACEVLGSERTTDRIAFDLDCKRASDLADRNDRYRALREVMGPEHEPLVYGTPSRFGLRVVYRIPETPLASIVTGGREGLIAEVLRAADLAPERGRVEIFPQASLPDRMMFGRRMPLLDPETLTSIGAPVIGDGFDPAALIWALRYVEAWHSRPLVGFLDHLSKRPRVDLREDPVSGRGIATLPDASGAPLATTVSGRRLTLGSELARLVNGGLTRPSSRYESEFLVAIAFVAGPELFPAYGLSRSSSDGDVAVAVARWLSQHHNGLSAEWRESQRRAGGAGPLAWWVKRYLRTGGRGNTHMIARARRVALALMPSLRRVVQLTPREHQQAHMLAAANFPAGSKRYRFEVWVNCYLRALKRIELFHHRRGLPRPARGVGAYRELNVEIAAEWMEDWPFGKGEHGAQYTVYCGILRNAGWLSDAGGYLSPTLVAPNYPAAFTGSARTYWARTFDPLPMAGDLAYAPWELTPAMQGLDRRYMRTWTMDEVYHALWAREAGVAAARCWKRDTRLTLDTLLEHVMPRADHAKRYGHQTGKAA